MTDPGSMTALGEMMLTLTAVLAILVSAAIILVLILWVVYSVIYLLHGVLGIAWAAYRDDRRAMDRLAKALYAITHWATISITGYLCMMMMSMVTLTLFEVSGELANRPDVVRKASNAASLEEFLPMIAVVVALAVLGVFGHVASTYLGYESEVTDVAE